MPGQRRVRELCDMPRVETTVHDAVAEAFKQDARDRGVSISTVLREALYEYAQDFLGVQVEAPRPTAYAQK
ncbi:CopG family transcriptional regulator [Streptomyces globisporus]|uniref:CopG family transcriptional regulator n=1 Tax=Streptomyces globisporus TaxID=1908 RepID=UPI0037CB95F6